MKIKNKSLLKKKRTKKKTQRKYRNKTLIKLRGAGNRASPKKRQKLNNQEEPNTNNELNLTIPPNRGDVLYALKQFFNFYPQITVYAHSGQTEGLTCNLCGKAGPPTTQELFNLTHVLGASLIFGYITASNFCSMFGALSSDNKVKNPRFKRRTSIKNVIKTVTQMESVYTKERNKSPNAFKGQTPEWDTAWCFISKFMKDVDASNLDRTFFFQDKDEDVTILINGEIFSMINLIKRYLEIQPKKTGCYCWYCIVILILTHLNFCSFKQTEKGKPQPFIFHTSDHAFEITIGLQIVPYIFIMIAGCMTNIHFGHYSQCAIPFKFSNNSSLPHFEEGHLSPFLKKIRKYVSKSTRSTIQQTSPWAIGYWDIDISNIRCPHMEKL